MRFAILTYQASTSSLCILNSSGGAGDLEILKSILFVAK